MTSRSLVLETLEFDLPSRIPRQLWVLPWAVNHYPEKYAQIVRRFPDDIIVAKPFYKEPPQTSGDAYKVGCFIDEWGCRFESRQDGIIGEVKEPLIETWTDLEKIRPPKECLAVDIEAVNEQCRKTDKFVLAGCCPRPFERMQFLRGTENLMMDIALQESEFQEFVRRIHSFYMEELGIWAKSGVDGLMFMDDWGSQKSLLISPRLWREIFKPLYKDYIELAHTCGKKIFMHSDGYIMDILPDMVEMGLDAVNSQIFCMGIGELGRQFKGKITFWGEIDRQHLLPYGSRTDIVDAVKNVYYNLYQNGGVIAQLEFGPGANPDNVLTAFETWEQL